ncbi:uncharacterized histidine-rich protein DDB_G0274557-like [Cheilinus undulatus]|uniref:uncharacterized histidine-rich protein DDB_G0274557-like n=1 Tax=Cheilinus undulatus TaxID=241271 RepID=UPI001BD6477A|nr:uncharacterized histidine-rich protein DDB_G0274557-like [Cheilinus undulatus]
MTKTGKPDEYWAGVLSLYAQGKYRFSTGKKPGAKRWKAVIQRIDACPLTPVFNQRVREYDIFGKRIPCRCGYHRRRVVTCVGKRSVVQLGCFSTLKKAILWKAVCVMLHKSNYHYHQYNIHNIHCHHNHNVHHCHHNHNVHHCSHYSRPHQRHYSRPHQRHNSRLHQPHYSRLHQPHYSRPHQRHYSRPHQRHYSHPRQRHYSRLHQPHYSRLHQPHYSRPHQRHYSRPHQRHYSHPRQRHYSRPHQRHYSHDSCHQNWLNIFLSLLLPLPHGHI